MTKAKQTSVGLIHQLSILGIVVLLGMLLMTATNATRAQGDGQPTTIIDAAFQDLSQRLGHTVNRASNKYSWSQEEYANSSLGCPAPGKSYTQATRTGYKILIVDNTTTYDYRATLDGKLLFLCTSQGPSAPGGKIPTEQATQASNAAVTLVPPLSPQDASLPVTYNYPIAYIGPNGNVFITSAGKGAGTQITNDAAVKPEALVSIPNKIYSDLRWSPDGSKLLFRDSDGTLYIYASTGEGKAIPAKLAFGNPAAWAPDSSKVAYAVQTNQPGKVPNSIQMQIQTLSGTGDAPSVAATFEQQVGCGGGPNPDPAEQLYDLETGSGGNHLVFEWLPNGFLHSTACSGLGVALLDPQTGQDKWQLDGVGRISVSANRQSAVGIQIPPNSANGKIVSIDLASGKTTQLGEATNVDQVSISPDGNLVFYTILNTKTTVNGDPAKSTLGQKLFGTWPVDGISNQVTLWRIPITGVQGFSFFTQEGRGITQISSSADAMTIAVNFVTSSAAAVDAINKGGTVNTVLASRPVSIIYLLTPTTKQPSKLTNGRSAQIGANTSFTARPALGKITNVTCPGFLQSRLVVGQQGRVTPGEPNRLRSEAGGGTVLATIPGGALFTVLEGPLCAANGTAWWKVNYNNQVGWTPEGQGNTYFTEPVEKK